MEYLAVKHKPHHNASRRDIFLLLCTSVSPLYNISIHPFLLSCDAIQRNMNVPKEIIAHHTNAHDKRNRRPHNQT